MADHKMKELRARLARSDFGHFVKVFRVNTGGAALLRGGSLCTVRLPRASLVPAAPDLRHFYKMTAWPLVMIGTWSGILDSLIGRGPGASKGIRTNLSHTNEDGETDTAGLQDLFFRCGQYLQHKKPARDLDAFGDALKEVTSGFAGIGTAGIANAVGPEFSELSQFGKAVEGAENVGDVGLSALETGLAQGGGGHAGNKGRWNEAKYPPLFFVEFHSFEGSRIKGLTQLQPSKTGISRVDGDPRTLYKWKDVYPQVVKHLEVAVGTRRQG